LGLTYILPVFGVTYILPVFGVTYIPPVFGGDLHSARIWGDLHSARIWGDLHSLLYGADVGGEAGVCELRGAVVVVHEVDAPVARVPDLPAGRQDAQVLLPDLHPRQVSV
jgi:hypothetical protein